MQAKGWIMMRVLLNRFHKGSPESALNILSQDEVKTIMGLKFNSEDFKPMLAKTEAQLSKIHYSWLLPAIEKLPPNVRSIVVGALAKAQVIGLSKQFSPKDTSPISPLVKDFLLNSIYRYVQDPNVMPLEYLPQGPLNRLFDFEKQELVELIDFLGLYDLAIEIRSIVDKKILQQVYNCMTPKKQQFLRICLHQKEKITTPRLELEGWHGDCKKLNALLHKRGLLRLGKALAGQHPDFLWHFTRILDTGRGAIISKYYQKEAIPNVTTALTQQVINVMNSLKGGQSFGKDSETTKSAA